MKDKWFAALFARVKKIDDYTKSLRELSMGHGKSIITLNKQLTELVIPEDKNQEFAENFEQMEFKISASDSTFQESMKESRKAISGYVNQMTGKFNALEAAHKKIALQEPVTKIIEKTTVVEAAEPVPGKNGVGIEKIFINAQKHWIVIYTDGRRVDLGKIVTETYNRGSGVPFYEVVNISRPNIVFVNALMSPFTPLRPANGNLIIVVDDSAGDVIINLYARVLRDIIEIKKKATSDFKTTYNGITSNIDGVPSREILTKYDSVRLTAEADEWGRY